MFIYCGIIIITRNHHTNITIIKQKQEQVNQEEGPISGPRETSRETGSLISATHRRYITSTRTSARLCYLRAACKSDSKYEIEGLFLDIVYIRFNAECCIRQL